LPSANCGLAICTEVVVACRVRIIFPGWAQNASSPGPGGNEKRLARPGRAVCMAAVRDVPKPSLWSRASVFRSVPLTVILVKGKLPQQAQDLGKTNCLPETLTRMLGGTLSASEAKVNQRVLQSTGPSTIPGIAVKQKKQPITVEGLPDSSRASQDSHASSLLAPIAAGDALLAPTSLAMRRSTVGL
jgi:hypothetical protein